MRKSDIKQLDGMYYLGDLAEIDGDGWVDETAFSSWFVSKAVDLFVETIALEFIDINEESARWHDLYSKECQLYNLMSQFTKKESAEYKRRITSECFKWRIEKVKGFFCLRDDHEFNDEGHGYIDTRVEWGDTKVDIVIYRKLDRQPEFFVDLYGRENTSREARIKAEKDMEERFHNYISNQ